MQIDQIKSNNKTDNKLKHETNQTQLELVTFLLSIRRKLMKIVLRLDSRAAVATKHEQGEIAKNILYYLLTCSFSPITYLFPFFAGRDCGTEPVGTDFFENILLIPSTVSKLIGQYRSVQYQPKYQKILILVEPNTKYLQNMVSSIELFEFGTFVRPYSKIKIIFTVSFFVNVSQTLLR